MLFDKIKINQVGVLTIGKPDKVKRGFFRKASFSCCISLCGKAFA
jgi:hypothetical protein